jgi:hypothetical protein
VRSVMAAIATVLFFVALLWFIASLSDAPKPEICKGSERLAVKACAPWWFDNR